jgi:hypothetical protein
MSDQANEKRPYLGQRCHVEGQGFGTITAMQLVEQGLSLARVELDADRHERSYWYKYGEIELVDPYPAN